MDRGELPVWLGQTSFEEVVARPALTAALRAVVSQLHAQIWSSPARLATVGVGGAGAQARVAAQTLTGQSGAVITVVMLAVEGRLPDRPWALRKFIQMYSARFGGQKWARTRWFLTEAGGSLVELKLQSHADRRVWFLQEFNVL